ncbi:MAG: PD-(D/E)XK nuclease family protein [Leptolyngbyaceae cyanobacterium T60_A2020_046]|nr:PD-(D/E)XK nuclease family protein [Leptolyngbyaceae cyanobacterium T60_A2020_046]
MRLSQGHLTLLDECPRRFQHTVLDGLTVPAAPELLAGQQWGDRFHLFMQQREMGLPVADLVANDRELQESWEALRAIAPDLFVCDEIFRQSEHERSRVVNGYWFTVVYDLLRLWGDRGEIVDWKTYLRPKPAAALQRDWQTRLYLYMLVETTDLTPAQVTMTYWFVRTRDRQTQHIAPQCVHIAYTADRHAQTHHDVLRLTTQLSQWQAQGNPLPQVPMGSDRCHRCPFAIRCQRGSAPEPTLMLPALDDIAEIPL